jgi:hypothetical protein
MSLASLFPSGSYTPEDTATSRYFNAKKLKDGDSTTLRLCGTPSSHHAICGYTYFTMEGRPRRFPQFPKNYLDDIGLTYDGKKNGTGEKDRPVFFLSWVCLRKENPDEFQVFDISQGKIREQIEAVLSMEDYEILDGEMANFFLTVTRKGTGTDTAYTVVPTLKVATKADQQRWQQSKDSIYLPALYEGGDPFGGKPSEPGSTPPSGTPLSHRDELGADHEVGAAAGW